MLIAESLEPPVVSANCAVASGRWFDPYIAVTFVAPGELDIDHVVALANAWRSGAWAWTHAQRVAFANDLDQPEVLIAVGASVNRSKGDLGPDEWKPPNAGVWCSYARAWVSVKTAWRLTVTAAEKASLSSMLATCPA